MNPPGTMDKIALIKISVRCFICGILGFLPLIGIPFAAIAIGNFRRVFFGKSTLWNPAARYLRVGMICGMAGILLNVILVGAMKWDESRAPGGQSAKKFSF